MFSIDDCIHKCGIFIQNLKIRKSSVIYIFHSRLCLPQTDTPVIFETPDIESLATIDSGKEENSRKS